MAPTIAELSSSDASEGSTPPTGYGPQSFYDDVPGFNDMPAGSVEPIAIIGMGMRLPGGVHDAESFWKLLIEKRDGRCKVPTDRYNVDAFYGPGKPGHVNTKYGYFLNDLDLAHCDVGFWSMSKQEVERVDPSNDFSWRLFMSASRMLVPIRIVVRRSDAMLVCLVKTGWTCKAKIARSLACTVLRATAIL